ARAGSPSAAAGPLRALPQPRAGGGRARRGRRRHLPRLPRAHGDRRRRARARSRPARPHITLAPPRIRKPGEDKIDRYLASLEPDALLVRGLGALRERGGGIPRIGDVSLNV